MATRTPRGPTPARTHRRTLPRARPGNRYGWIPEAAWQAAVGAAAAIPQLKDLPDSLQRHGDQWRTWSESDTPEAEPVPELASAPANRLHRLNMLVLLAAFRPDRLPAAAAAYATEVLGGEMRVAAASAAAAAAAAPAPAVEAALAASTARTPLVCVCEPGANPVEAILRLGKRLKRTVRLLPAAPAGPAAGGGGGSGGGGGGAGVAQQQPRRHHLDTAMPLGHWSSLAHSPPTSPQPPPHPPPF